MTFWQNLITTFFHPTAPQKEVAEQNKRINNKTHTNTTFKGRRMSQARVLTERELNKVLGYCDEQPHARRNRAILLCTHLAGMRVGTVASLTIADVLAKDGTIKDEIRLSGTQFKGNRSVTVYIPQRLQAELLKYLQYRFGIKNLTAVAYTDTTQALFPTQKSLVNGFTANTLCQLLCSIYKHAGIEGATSHSGRRSFITKLADKGVGVHVLMHLASHRSLNTTQKYISTNPSIMKAAVELV